MTVLRGIHAQQSNNTVTSCHGLNTQTLMNVLKESVVVHRTVLTQTGATTALAMMATSLLMMIIIAMVYKVKLTLLYCGKFSRGSFFTDGQSLPFWITGLAFTDACTPAHCVYTVQLRGLYFVGLIFAVGDHPQKPWKLAMAPRNFPTIILWWFGV